MDKLSQITLENTVSIKVDCLLNQQLLAKNFAIIMDCLKDLKTQQDKHSSLIGDIPNFNEMFQKFKNQINTQLKDHKNSQITTESNNNNNKQQSRQNARKGSSTSNLANQQKQHKQSNDSNKDLLKQLEQLKARMTKNEGFTIDNTKDINLLNKDMKQAKQQIQKLKEMLKNISSAGQDNKNSVNNAALSKNQNLHQQSINNLNKQSQQNSNNLKKMQKQMAEMKSNIKNLNKQLEDLKNLINENNNSNDNKNQEQIVEIADNSNVDNKTINDLIKKVQYLNKKTDSLQNQSNGHTKNINDLNQNIDKNNEDINDLKQNLNGVHQQIQQINKILEQLQNVNNQDNNNMLNEIDKLKEQMQKIMKLINSNSLNNKDKKMSKNQDSSSSIEGGSNKNLSRNLNDRSFRKRADSSAKQDLNAKINQLTSRILYLQKLMSSKLASQENPQKLPSVHRKQNMTFYNGQKSHKKQMNELKNQLEIWIKAYLNNMNKNAPNMSDLELKIQQLRNVISKKADQQGMKKGLSFLQGKITQLYLFLTEPDAQDAMIVRKGFNCLSCSKKVQTLRGKLGPRMNWDNLNVNNHTPPKNGFPKYADTNQRDSL